MKFITRKEHYISRSTKLNNETSHDGHLNVSLAALHGATRVVAGEVQSEVLRRRSGRFQANEQIFESLTAMLGALISLGIVRSRE